MPEPLRSQELFGKRRLRMRGASRGQSEALAFGLGASLPAPVLPPPGIPPYALPLILPDRQRLAVLSRFLQHIVFQ